MEKINITDFENIVEALRKNVEYYERALEPTRYFMALANGDRVNLSIPKKTIGHLLGIKIDELKSSGIVKSDIKIYEVLQKLINCDMTYQSLKNKNFPLELLFSEHIAKKLEIFIDIIKIRTDDLVCVLKYYSDRAYLQGENAINCDYFIIRKHDGGVYSALGIVRDDFDSRKFVPVTSRLFLNKEELDEFLSLFKNQEITYPTTFSIENYQQEYQKTIYSNLDNKLKWCKELKYLSMEYGLIPVNNSDVMFIIEKFMNSNRDNNNQTSIINAIIDSMKGGSVIDKTYLMESLGIKFIPEEVEALIDALNDHICSNAATFNVGEEYSYTELTNRINELEEENNSDKKELERVQAQLRIAQEEIERLKEQLAVSEQCIDIYSGAAAKVLALRESSKGLSKL